MLDAYVVAQAGVLESHPLVVHDRVVGAVIEDDGRGFDPDQSVDGGIGLIGMRERVALLDGSMTIETAPGKGTTLVIEVPVR